MLRRAFRISLPIVDAASTPPNAKATVDQKKTFFRSIAGTTVDRSMAVAEPNRDHATEPMTMSIVAGTQVPIAPRL